MSYHERHRTDERMTAMMRHIAPQVFRSRYELPAFAYQPAPAPPIPMPPPSDEWTTIAPESYWGQWNTHFYLQTAFTVPSECGRGEKTLALHLPIGSADDFFNAHPEALVYLDGQRIGTVDMRHQVVMLPALVADSTYTLTLAGWTGIGGSYWGETRTQLFMGRPALVQIDPPTRELVAALRTTWEVARTLDDHHPARGPLWDGIEAALNALDTRQPIDSRFYASVPAARDALNAALKRAGHPLDVQIDAVGHAHIDVAWMWPLSVTRGKAARTFTTAVSLMAQFPEYQFSQSQPQLYEFVRQDHPELFAQIRERVERGQWEPMGGMWIEADCNMSSGESLVRQFLYGRRYFQTQFGTDTPVLWLPDAFGFPWSLPQIMAGAGITRFFTIKIGWSQFAQLPHDSFWWQGIDGTRVLTHCSPTPEPFTRDERATYNALASGEYALKTWYNTKNKDLDTHLLMSYGWGDGGGGPTPEMVENIRLLSDFPAAPQVRPSSVGDFFDALEARADRLPVWSDELYLQYHQGTYTSQAATKAANRRSEFLLHTVEFAAAYAATLDSAYVYPHDALERLWKILLLNQFHDILPGSSVAAVYDDAARAYDELERGAHALLDSAFAVLREHVGGDVWLLNPSAVPQAVAVWMNGQLSSRQRLVNASDDIVLTQAITDGLYITLSEPMPPYSAMPLYIKAGDSPTATHMSSAKPNRLSNRYLRVTLNENGDIVSIYDRQHEREVLAPNAIGNQFVLYEDNPKDFDAWNIDPSYEAKQWPAERATSVRVVESGPLRATLEVERHIGRSAIIQRISLSSDSPRIDFDTTVLWHERHMLLKVAFPVDVLAPRATYDIQFGNIERPTHRNTRWDWGRYEVPAQKWADLSEGDYGVSLLNESKYGCDVHDNVLRLTLLRSPAYPDPDTDSGTHRFRYSLLPHSVGWGRETVDAAYALNNPLWAMGGAGHDGTTLDALVTTDAPNIIIETVKQAESSNGVVVRFYENHRQRGPVTLTFARPVVNAERVNLLEELTHDPAPTVGGHTVTVESVRPYEIVSLRVRLA